MSVPLTSPAAGASVPVVGEHHVALPTSCPHISRLDVLDGVRCACGPAVVISQPRLWPLVAAIAAITSPLPTGPALPAPHQ